MPSNQNSSDEYYMSLAIEQAKIAKSLGEVPVGALIVKESKVIASAYNRRESDRNSLSHAEILAINKACHLLNGWRLCGCKIYVTLEPCPMCAGAIMNSRLDGVIYATPDYRCGAFSSVIDVSSISYYSKIQIKSGVLKDESVGLLKDFFKKLRDGSK